MKLKLVLIVAFLGLCLPHEIVVGQQISSKCLPIIDPSFTRVNAKEFILYEVNSDYLLQAEFQKKCELSKIDISPKYFWNDLNSEWKEPEYLVSLSTDWYTELIGKINRIKPLGSLVYSGQTGFVTNATLRLVDRYEKAYVERRLYDSIGEEDQPMKIASFSVYFIRLVDGKVSDKNLTGISEADKRARLKINDKWYWVDEREYEKAVVGGRGVFRVAGPIG